MKLFRSEVPFWVLVLAAIVAFTWWQGKRQQVANVGLTG